MPLPELWCLYFLPPNNHIQYQDVQQQGNTKVILQAFMKEDKGEGYKFLFRDLR